MKYVKAKISDSELRQFGMRQNIRSTASNLKAGLSAAASNDTSKGDKIKSIKDKKKQIQDQLKDIPNQKKALDDKKKELQDQLRELNAELRNL